MDYMEFLDAVRDYINETSSQVRASVYSTVKNNGVRLYGLSFGREGYNASPTIYMENHYDEYLNGADICEIGDKLLALYHDNDLSVNFDMSFFDDFEKIKKRLYIKLINREKNTDFLMEAPYEEFLDLAIVPYVRVYDKRIGNGIIMVRNEHLRLWKKEEREVMEAAKKNTHDHDGFNLRHIMDCLNVSSGKTTGPVDDRSFPMYVATNRKMTNGAAVLTMKDKLREYADVLGGDYYIIPSSVHEIILLAKEPDSYCDINDMIREVNATSLGPDDVLSDHAYMYSMKDEVLIF